MSLSVPEVYFLNGRVPERELEEPFPDLHFVLVNEQGGFYRYATFFE
jgi:hypothetical protein